MVSRFDDMMKSQGSDADGRDHRPVPLLPAALGIFMPGPQAGQMIFGLQMGAHAFTVTLAAGATQADVGRQISRLGHEISKAAGVASGGDFIERLKTERSELSGRLDKLRAFLRDRPDTVDGVQREMLEAQAGHMTEYLAILDARIENIEHDISRRETSQGRRQDLDAEPDVREVGAADPVRDGPINFGD